MKPVLNPFFSFYNIRFVPYSPRIFRYSNHTVPTLPYFPLTYGGIADYRFYCLLDLTARKLSAFRNYLL